MTSIANSFSETTSFTYDGEGKLLSQVNARVVSIEGSTVSTKRVYVYLGEMLIGEILAGTPKIAYTSGPGGLISQRDMGASTSRWYHYGPQGETRALTNGSGTVTDSYRYTAYGVPLSATGSSYNPYRYGGKYGYYTQGDSGLIKAGARWYHPYTFRWTSRDPIKYRGGENLLEYVGGNPVRWSDPTGLAHCTYSISTSTLSCTPNLEGPGIVIGPGGIFSGIGTCVNNPACVSNNSMGPIPPGSYRMNPDDRTGHEDFWRLEPNPNISGWECRTGLKRCGFMLHPGLTSLGCITVDKFNTEAMRLYRILLALLQLEKGNNDLKVTG